MWRVPQPNEMLGFPADYEDKVLGSKFLGLIRRSQLMVYHARFSSIETSSPSSRPYYELLS